MFDNKFFEVFGVRRRSVARYAEHVLKLNDRSGYIDLFWPRVLIVEQKDIGSNLENPSDRLGSTSTRCAPATTRVSLW